MKNRYLALLIFSFILLISALNANHRMIAEWEPMRGVLIRHPFGVPMSLIREIALQDTVYILVADALAQNQAAYTLQSGEVNLFNCRYVIAPTNSHWTRDWGAHSMFWQDSEAAIIDPMFDGYPWVPGSREDRDYDLDDAVNGILAAYLDVMHVDFPAYLTGGNFMTDGYGTAITTHQMLDENSSMMDTDQFLAYCFSLMGIGTYHTTTNPEEYGIQHIDCWAKLLSEEVFLVKQLPEWHPEYDSAESIASQFAETLSCFGRPYRVVRIFCDTYSGTSAAAYTNSLILNKRVFVPTFGIPADSVALQTYRDSMPGYQVLGFDGAWYHYDALHCRTMGIADFQMLRIEHQPPSQSTNIQNGIYEISARVRSYGNFSLVPESLRVRYRVDPDTLWHSVSLQPSGINNIYNASISGLISFERLNYYLEAEDSSGRQQKMPIAAPSIWYNTFIENEVANQDASNPPAMINIYPMPAKDILHVSGWTIKNPATEIKLYNLRGQLLYSQKLSSLQDEAQINLDGVKTGSGIHFIKIFRNQGQSQHRILLLK